MNTLKDIVDKFPPTQDFYLSTGCAFFFIGTKDEILAYNPDLMEREVLEHYAKISDNGYIVIIVGEENGRYWFKSEMKENTTAYTAKSTNAKHIDGYYTAKEIAHKYGISACTVTSYIKRGLIKGEKIDRCCYIKREIANEFFTDEVVEKIKSKGMNRRV